ncbi:TPA: hypothetical protein RZK31_000974 [Campylobacter coli]|nr:hypothetical protein [Campylobacter coli]HEB9328879.1 hypothetical protein [Campylobacter coli]HEB9333748.1 hypothetical protein [Campylobacter coli]
MCLIYSDNMRARADFGSSSEFSKLRCNFEMCCGFCFGLIFAGFFDFM